MDTDPGNLPGDWLARQKKVISIYNFWVIVLLLRWFMNHNSCNSLLVILRYLNRSMVVGSSTGQAKYLDRSRNLSKDHRTISLATWITWIFARWLIGSTKKVISIYTFWVIVLLLRWFMNHKTTVQSFTCWFQFW